MEDSRRKKIDELGEKINALQKEITNFGIDSKKMIDELDEKLRTRVHYTIDMDIDSPPLPTEYLAYNVLDFKDDQWFIKGFKSDYKEFTLIDNYKNVYTVTQDFERAYFGYYGEYPVQIYPKPGINFGGYDATLWKRNNKRPLTTSEIDTIRLIYDKRSMVDILSRIF